MLVEHPLIRSYKFFHLNIHEIKTQTIQRNMEQDMDLASKIDIMASSPEEGVPLLKEVGSTFPLKILLLLIH